MNIFPEKFTNKKYLVAKNSISKDLIKVLSEYLWLNKKLNRLGNETYVKADVLCREPVFETVLDFLTDTIAKLTGLSLIPTYAYARVYHQGAKLPRHIDRQPCEISCTIPLDYPKKKGWDIFTSLTANGDKNERIELQKGDMLIYKGEEVYHWREELTEEWQTQLFIHFVDKQGTNQEWAYDKRPQLSMDLIRLDIFNGTENETEKLDKFVYFIKQQIRILKIIYYYKRYRFWALAILAGSLTKLYIF